MANPQRFLAQVVSGGVLCVALSCDNAVAPALKLDDHVGMYALAQVDGHQLGWYHQMGAVDCSAAAFRAISTWTSSNGDSTGVQANACPRVR